MFRSVSVAGQSSPPAAGPGGSSPGSDSQDSSWIGLLSAVSRPAWSILHKYLPRVRNPGRAREPLLCDSGSELWRQLEGIDLCPQTHIGSLSSAGTLLRTVHLSASQGVPPPAGSRWVAVQSGTWWGSFWGEDRTPPGLLCPQQTAFETKETTGVFVQRGGGRTLGENTGATPHKEEPANNGGPLTVQKAEGSTAARLSTSTQLVLDHGYCSLEEGQGAAPPQEGSAHMEEDTCEEGGSSSGPGASPPSPPQNKAIAFIMGCPCSDDSQSEDSDDDGGFDSEGSSDLTSTEEEEDEEEEEEEEDEEEEEEEEEDSDSERLWSSLCRTLDPYNPRTFTAQLHTGRTIPPPSAPPLSSSPLSSSSPPSGSDVWDDSASASEVDEAESLLLWSSFSCSSDPYSPFNFQAPLRTREPVEAGPRARTRKASQTPPRCPHPTPTSPPEYRKEEAEERLDSGFSEPCSSSCSTRTSSCSTRTSSCSTRTSSCSTRTSCSTNKKVRFCDQVEEFFTSGGEEDEDRRGPWEELARDRCRFLRRCQEVEQSIAYCLQPQHRSLVYHRLQDA